MIDAHRVIWALYVLAVLVIFLIIFVPASQQVPKECVRYTTTGTSQPSGHSTAFYDCVNRETGRAAILAVVIPVIPALTLSYTLGRKKRKKSLSHHSEQ